MQLVAARFVLTGRAPIDLASGDPVTLRALAPCPAEDERRWVDSCARLLRTWHEDLPPLLDYGFTADGRFEAYGCRESQPFSRGASTAITAFLEGAPPAQALSRGPVRVGVRLVIPPALLALEEILEDGRPGRPVSVACVAPPGAGATTFLRLAASRARALGYIPIAASAFSRWPELEEGLQARSVLLLCDSHEPRAAAERGFFRLGLSRVTSLVCVRVVDRVSRASDVTLRIDPIEPAVLAGCVHVYPAIDARRVLLAAEASGGLPKAFVEILHDADRRRSSSLLRVAEAHPAYTADEPAEEPPVEHPWRDLISRAVQLGAEGRTAAAERDLRQIAAAAERRQVAAAAFTAQIELGRLLLARGRVDRAGPLFNGVVQSQVQPLAARAAVALGYVQLAQGNLDEAESTFRVCRARCPGEAAVGLGWTLLAKALDYEAERALADARSAMGDSTRGAAAVLRAAIALVRHNLPSAARAAREAIAAAIDDPISVAVAASLLVAVHGRLGDADGVEAEALRARAAARSARAPWLALCARAASIEARHNCGQALRRAELDRLLRVADRLPPLLRAWLLGAGARVHPSEPRRADLFEAVQAFVRATGARALSPAALEAPGASFAADTAALVGIVESSTTPAGTLALVAEWLRARLHARSVVVADAAGAPLARAGAHDPIAAVQRVLTTRVAQPPWTAANGLEAAVVARYGDAVQGAIACRWPLSRIVAPEVVAVLSAAAAFVGPAVALLVERASAAPAPPDGIVGRSPAVARLRAQISRAAAAPFPVLVEGESGAGKELVARAIHRESTRRLRSCVAINCAAISDDLFEAEMFGHARGAFTGAHAERAGLFEQADGGTLFLDEVSELSPRAQAKLLRALQEGEVRRLGETHARRVDVRVIAASNRRLDEEVSAGRFRRDLLFRLAVIRIAVPSLRERREDIPLLAAHCWEAAARRAGSRSMLTPSAVSRLSLYEWPGNVRELQNVIAALAVQVPRGRVEAGHVDALTGMEPPVNESLGETARRLKDARHALERDLVTAALARCGGRHGAAARQLGITRQGLTKLLKRLEL